MKIGKRFATNEPAANGQLALALAIAILGRLDSHQIEQALNEARNLLPNGGGRRDQEALELWKGVRQGFGLLPGGHPPD